MAGALVSCLCVTRNRVPLLRRAVACFRAQTYAPRELLVVHDEDDEATREYLSGLGDDPSIRAVCVAGRPTLGALRNLAVDASRGDRVAQWDDDDWSAPERLAVQAGVLEGGAYAACVLNRWTMFDTSTGTAYLSCARPWEGSLLADRTSLPRYPDLPRGEDTPVIEALVARRRLAALDRPDLYIYVHHGGNTWQRVHWKRRMLAGATPLSPGESQRVRETLEASPCS